MWNAIPFTIHLLASGDVLKFLRIFYDQDFTVVHSAIVWLSGAN